MTLRSFALALVLVFLAGGRMAVQAHRLDEYLQATRLAVGIDRVNVEIDLTAGTRIAQQIIEAIDTNRDGRLSATERAEYARQVLGALVLEVDGRRALLSLVDGRFPEASDIALGIGVIQLRATAGMPPASFGSHRVMYSNNHKPEASVYLANALVPSDHRIQIAAQRRDPQQRSLTVNYRVMSDARSYRAWWSLTGLAMTIGLTRARRRRAEPLVPPATMAEYSRSAGRSCPDRTSS